MHMGQYLTRQSGGEQQRLLAVTWRRVRWFSVCLFLLVAACTPIPAPSSVTPTATRSAPQASITAYHGHTSTVFAVAWSPDGRRIATGGNDSTVQVWDARTGHLSVAYSGHTGTVYAVAWSPDGKRIASGSDDNTVQVWEATSGHLLLTYTGHTAGVRALAWSPDGTRIVSGGNDNTIQVWNATSGKRLLTYTGHLGSIWAVAWSPDGRSIVSATGNISDERRMETVQVWNAMTGHLISS